MEQTFKERFYNELVGVIIEDIANNNYGSGMLGEFFPFVDNNKWGEYNMNLKVDEVIDDDDEVIYEYLKVEIDKLEVVACVSNEGDIKRIPLNVDKDKVNELVNQSLYDDMEDISEEYYDSLEANAYQDYEGED